LPESEAALLSYDAVLTASQISYEIGSRPVLRDVSFTVGPGSRLGVIGPNGVGKSTLLRIAAGLVTPSAGELKLTPPRATVGYLAQQRARSPETVGDYLLRSTGVAEAEAELTEAAAALAESPDAADRYSAALERWTSLGGGDVEARVAGAMEDLGLEPELGAQPRAALSGGQAAKVALAAALLSRHDVLLLDEPTNDLDFDGLERLERMVTARRGPLVVVSHDRAFLDRTVTDVLELDEHTRTATGYGGGWQAYVEERRNRRRLASEAYETFASRRQGLLERAQRERQWATTGAGRLKKASPDKDKMQRDFKLNRTERLASRARRTERALERLEAVEKPWEGWDLRFAINESQRAGAVVARFESAVLERGGFRLGPLDLEINWGDRLAVVGPNGTGKTTLIEALLGRLAPAAGSVRLGPGVVVGELGQERAGLKQGADLLSAVMARTGFIVSDARSLLAKFGLGPHHVGRSWATLSPGERTRAELAIFQARGVNFVVLDEPTNHLDLPAIEQLEEALDGFSGTLLLVSHDRWLLESVDLTRTLDLGRPEVEAGVGR
jgi:ATPase subunit of ABC transporter with duplicated ATPase domains